ncbi:DnaA regulatory inactivator Hda [Mangrovimicrobium sediminis]|uniref:DnaA regulatory inactivator Hda n=1 Tax=Mangrovimicrobium sediminis TaxID=2562682 RepID=A0A4Z0LVL6_9GAMM|nr:DnaA regulatory inactivator Hda [Haliea sp. SAOS-164]TGD71166.1 DnaA regulatory inactivator Hda [Haliea sp. SAOS-164]
MAAISVGATGGQLPLPIQLRDDATLDNFLPAPATEALLPVLRGQCSAAGEAVVFLHGAEGSGKSHLLQAGCHLAGGGAVYLPLAELAEYPPADVLAGAGELRLAALDDLQAVLGQRDWELALFAFFNHARESGCRLLLAANGSPRALDCGLEDLRSRLGWGGVFHLPTPDDLQKQVILQFRARRRGLQLTDEGAAYIVARAPRALAPLLALLDQLDRQSLAQQRALTIPFIRQALDW